MTHFRRTLIISGFLTLLLLTPFYVVAQKDVVRLAALSNQDFSRAHSASNYALNAAGRRLAYRSQQFKGTLEHELNRSYLDGTPGEKRANQLSARFHKAADTLRALYAVGRNVETSRTEALNLLRLGAELDDLVSQTHVSRTTLRSWDAIGRELFLLATVYDFVPDSVENPDTQGDAYAQVVEYHGAASSYSRIWLWPFLERNLKRPAQ